MMKRILEVFGKEYKQEMKYQEIESAMVDDFKLKNKSDDVEEIVKRLKNSSFSSNFKMNVGEY